MPNTADYFVLRGLQPSAPESLNASLKRVLDAMPTVLYGDPGEELTAGEQVILRAGGIDLDTELKADPLADTAVKFAALVESSLTIKDVAKSIGKSENHIRQMIARGTLYSILLENRRYIPFFQFDRSGRLLPHITRVNAALRKTLHPVSVFEWYTEPHPDLYLDDDIDRTVSPIGWLGSGLDWQKVVALAKQMP